MAGRGAGPRPARHLPILAANLQAATDLTRRAAADAAGSGGGTTELRDWRIVTPPAPAELAEYRSAEAATGAPWEFLAATLRRDPHRTDPGQQRGRRQGPMQFILTTWDIYGDGGDINTTHDAIHALARILANNGAPSNVPMTLCSYNPSTRMSGP